MNQQIQMQIEKELKEVRAKDIMSRFAITVKGSDTLSSAAHLMIRFKVSGLPVVSAEGKIIGIITATDLFRLMGEKASSRKISSEKSDLIRDHMTGEVYTIEEDTSLFDIIALMHGKNIHTLPVLKMGDICGIIGRRDVLYTYYKVLDKYQ